MHVRRRVAPTHGCEASGIVAERLNGAGVYLGCGGHLIALLKVLVTCGIRA
jgi:hypothetical protein